MTLLDHWAVVVLLLALSAVVALWTAGAIYYDVGDRTGFRRTLALGWLAAVVALFALWQPVWQPFLVVQGVFVGFTAWWLTLKPRQNRDWDDTTNRLPRADIDGDTVRLHNVWNHEYRTFTDFTHRYAIRTVRLNNLVAVDVLFFYWGSAWMCHPVMCFDFGPDGRVCFSIEVRFRKGEAYSPLRGLYRQHEMAVHVTDEYDAIARRTKYGTDAGYLYRLHVPAERVRNMFLDYVTAVNRLARTPQWYHVLCANCTTSFFDFPHSPRRCDWTVIANGRLPRSLYADGVLDRSVPFDVLRCAAYLNEIVKTAPREGFGDYIRVRIAEAKAAR